MDNMSGSIENTPPPGLTDSTSVTIYNNIFFLIPKTGPNSHTTLTDESSEYTNYLPNQAEIQALLDEITELREQNLQLIVDMGNMFAVNEDIKSLTDNAEGFN